jgi:hypothetical protein
MTYIWLRKVTYTRHTVCYYQYVKCFQPYKPAGMSAHMILRLPEECNKYANLF